MTFKLVWTTSDNILFLTINSTPDYPCESKVSTVTPSKVLLDYFQIYIILLKQHFNRLKQKITASILLNGRIEAVLFGKGG